MTRDLDAPEEVHRIARRLRSAGYETWAVGGAVRDALAGGHPDDWDLTTAARPEEVRALFRRTIPIGIEHGTVGILGKDGKLYEVTTFRLDVETDGRRARVSFADTLEEDLDRRDFTINAVAWDPDTREIRDPHHGVEDLAAGILRTVGDPAARFAEDRLRVLRALRFAGRFGLRIDEPTWAAIRDSADRLGTLSAERLREELYKVLGGPGRAATTLQLYAESGVLGALYPELARCVGSADPRGDGDIWSHLLATVEEVPSSRLVLRLAALLHDIGRVPQPSDDQAPATDIHSAAGAAMARELLQRLKCSNAETDRVVHLIAQHSSLPSAAASDAEVRRWLRLAGRDHYRDLIRLRIADCRARGHSPDELRSMIRRVRREIHGRAPLEVGELAIGGAELRELGIRPGPRFGEILRELLERVTDDPSLNTPTALMRIAAEMVLKGEE